MKAVDDQEGSSTWASAIKVELLLQELPRLRSMSSTIENFRQLQPILDITSASDYAQLLVKLENTRKQLNEMVEKLEIIESNQRQYIEAEGTLVTLMEDKILDIESRLP